jgi:hypothetical protein
VTWQAVLDFGSPFPLFVTSLATHQAIIALPFNYLLRAFLVFTKLDHQLKERFASLTRDKSRKLSMAAAIGLAITTSAASLSGKPCQRRYAKEASVAHECFDVFLSNLFLQMPRRQCVLRV